MRFWGGSGWGGSRGVYSKAPFFLFLFYQISKPRAQVRHQSKPINIFLLNFFFIHNFLWNRFHPSRVIFIHNLDARLSFKIGWKVFMHLWFLTSHNFHIWAQISMILASSNSYLQALRNNELTTIFGECEVGNPETNFPIFGIYFT